MYKPYLFLLFVLIIFSCTKNDKRIPEAEKAKVDLKIERLEKQLFTFKGKPDVEKFLQKYPSFVTEFLGLPYPVKDSQFIQIFYDLYSNPALHRFYEEAQKEFGDFSDIKAQMEGMFAYIKYFYPNYKIPKVETAITGFKFNKDMAVSDDAIIISYDYFLGPKASQRPNLFDYFLVRYRKPYLTSMIALALSSKFNNADLNDQTMVASMIYYGKAHYFVERVLPDLADSLNIMYSGQELEEVEKHKNLIWGHFISEKLLFNSTRFIVDKYCGERPKVVEIGNKCPGRIGRWLGWQIVRSYMREHPEVTLKQLMEEKDAQKIFKQSKFNPDR